MYKSHIPIFFLAVFLSFSPLAKGSQFKIWPVMTLDNKIITNHDLSEYIKATRLTDAIKVNFFKQASGDFQAYQELVTKWSKKYEQASLKKLAYYKILEMEAFDKLVYKKPLAFNITPSQLFNQVNQQEMKLLKSDLDAGLGIKTAYYNFGKELINQGYPHNGEGPEEVYFAWKKSFEAKLKEDIRANQARKQEAVGIMEEASEKNIPMLASSIFLNKQEDIIKAQLHNQRLTNKEIAQFFIKNPEAKVVIKSIKRKTLAENTLASIRISDKKHFDNLAATISASLSSFLKDPKLILKFKKYLKLASSLANGPESATSLKKIAQEKLNSFSAGGPYVLLMSAKIYKLAALILEKKLNFGDLKNVPTLYTEKIIKPTLAEIKSKTIFNIKNNNKYNFEKVLSIELDAKSSKALQENAPEAFKEFFGLYSWYVKYQVKKIALNDKSLAIVNIKSRQEFQTWKDIKKHLLAKLKKKALIKYKSKYLMNKYNYRLSIRVNGPLSAKKQGMAAWNFLFP